MKDYAVNWQHLPGANNVTRTVLPNGIIVLCKSDFNSPSVVISGYLHSGAIRDPDDKLGLALLTSYSLMRGTRQRSFRKIYDDLESVGASFGFNASILSTSFGGKALDEDLPLLLKTLSGALLNPVFPARQIQKLKAQMISSLQMRDQNTGEIASIRFDEVLFPNHPYGRPEDGRLATIHKIRRADIFEFHRRSYGPQGMVIVLVGALEAGRAAELVFEVLGKWENPEWENAPAIPDYEALEAPVEEFIPVDGKFQMDLIMGVHGPSRPSEDFLSASVGNNILGQFGMMGRIGNAVREKSGLAYHASTSLNAWLKGGTWEISAGINPENYRKAIDLIKGELWRFIEEPVSEEELEESKSSFIGSIPLSVESNSGVAGAILRMERFGLGLNFLQEFPARIEKISRDSVLAVAQKYIDPERMVIIGAGPRINSGGNVARNGVLNDS